MKVDELLKRLEDIKIDENKIDEKHEIAKYLARMFGHDKVTRARHNLMTKDKTIYDFDSYVNLYKSNKISPNDAFIYVEYYDFTYRPANYFYPFLVTIYLLPNAYLSKLGLEFDYYRVAPATGLKYIAAVGKFSKINRIVVEVADINTATINTNLLTLIHGVLGTKHSAKYATYDEVVEIMSRFSSQKLFAGYNFNEAWWIANRYYEDHDKLLAKDVEAIRDAYDRIFNPYRAVYDLKTKQFVV